jgi:hypothetical protein
MIEMRVLQIALTGLLFAAVGCSRAPTHTFEVFVRNETFEPITIGVTKDGPPYEARWASPEQIAYRTVTHDEMQWGQVVHAGRTADTTVRGQFPSRVYGWLRVYRGENLTLEDLMAVGRDSPNRVDVRLRPGDNVFTVREERNELVVERHQVPAGQ